MMPAAEQVLEPVSSPRSGLSVLFIRSLFVRDRTRICFGVGDRLVEVQGRRNVCLISDRRLAAAVGLFSGSDVIAIGGETIQMSVDLVLKPMVLARDDFDVPREFVLRFESRNRPAREAGSRFDLSALDELTLWLGLVWHVGTDLLNGARPATANF